MPTATKVGRHEAPAYDRERLSSAPSVGSVASRTIAAGRYSHPRSPNAVRSTRMLESLDDLESTTKRTITNIPGEPGKRHSISSVVYVRRWWRWYFAGFFNQACFSWLLK